MIIPVFVYSVFLLISNIVILNYISLFPIFFVFICLSQNISAMLLLKFNILNESNLTIFLSLKESLLLLVLFHVYLKNGFKVKNNYLEIVIVTGIIFQATTSILRGIDLSSIVAGIRQIYIFPVGFVAFYRLYYKSTAKINRVSIFLFTSIIIISASLIELLQNSEQYWYSIGYDKFQSVKNLQYLGGYLYGNMYSYNDGEAVNRIASITADPLITSYIALCSAVYFGASIFRSRESFEKVSLVLLFLGSCFACYLTLGRGAFLALCIAIAIFVLRNLLRISSWLSSLVISFLMTSIIVYGRSSIFDSISGQSHIQGLRDGINMGVGNIFGMGLGSAGNLVANSNLSNGAEIIVGDSFFGSTAYQIGIVGLIFVCFLFFLIIELIERNSGLHAYSPGVRAVGALMPGLLCCSVVNESVFSLVAMSVFLAVVATYCGQRESVLPARSDR